MQVIAEENWSWMLFAEDEAFFLSVVCGGVGLYLRDFELSPSEREEYAQKGAAYLASLAKQVAQDPGRFEARHLKEFSEMASVKKATELWRSTHGQRP